MLRKMILMAVIATAVGLFVIGTVLTQEYADIYGTITKNFGEDSGWLQVWHQELPSGPPIANAATKMGKGVWEYRIEHQPNGDYHVWVTYEDPLETCETPPELVELRGVDVRLDIIIYPSHCQ